MTRPLLSLDDARAAVQAAVRALPAEDVPVVEALDRGLAEDVVAEADVPAFAGSAMDGFALRSGPADRRLRIVGESRAGAPAAVPVGDGEAVRISTGGVVPDGADAVVMVERTEEDGDGGVLVRAATAPGENVRGPGEDLRAGVVALEAGIVLGPAALGVAVRAGRATVRCGARPRVAVLITGDELVPPGAPLGPGAIHESNSVVLLGLAQRAGAEVVLTSRVRDDPAATQAAVADALEQADVVVLTGGVSVGPHDHVKPALLAAGVQERFWRVALRPGKPTWFGVRGRQLVFGLPGNPVSAAVTFLLLVRPALAALQGVVTADGGGTATLAVDVARSTERTDAVRVWLANGCATPTGPQGSHVLSSLPGADALAILPPGEGDLPAGTVVPIVLI